MEAARAAVQKHLARDGQHDTTVHETINPAVTNEHVTRTKHEEAQTLVDREIHQDHYHTTVQPIKDREVLPEMHTHQMAEPQMREFHHGNDGKVLSGVEAEKARFKNTREIGETQYSRGKDVAVAGEHTHHHVHETIQPIVQKEIIAPSVVHTTIPIHEVHQNEAKFKPTSGLKPITMDEFQSSGGTLGAYGKDGLKDTFRGEPHGLGETLQPNNPRGTIGGRGADGTTSLTGDLDSKVGPNRGSIPGPIADKKGMESTSEGLSKMRISDSNNHGTATIKGTEKRGSFPLASGTSTSPTSATRSGAASTAANTASNTAATSATRTAPSTTTTTQTNTTTNTTTGSGHQRKSSSHNRPSADLYDEARDGSSSPKRKESLLSKIKSAIKH